MLVFVFSTMLAATYYDDWTQVVIDSWILSYESGFGRRSFIGTINTFIQDIGGVPLNYSPTLWYTLLAAVFCYYTYRILQYKSHHIAFYFVIFSPLGLAYLVNTSYSAGRAEIIMYAFLSAYTYHLLRHKVSVLSQLAFLLLFLCGVLSHEVTLFALPFLLLLSYKLIENQFLKYFSVFGFALVSALSSLAIVVYGTIDTEAACDYLLTRGVPEKVCIRGILFYHDHDIANNILYTVDLVFNNMLLYSLYIPAVIGGLIPLAFYFSLSPQQQQQQKTSLITLGRRSLICMLPLFIIAVDWGRWFNIWYIHVVLTGLALGYFAPPTNLVIGKSQDRFISKFYGYAFADSRKFIFCLILFSTMLYRIPVYSKGMLIGGIIPDAISNIVEYTVLYINM